MIKVGRVLWAGFIFSISILYFPDYMREVREVLTEFVENG